MDIVSACKSIRNCNDAFDSGKPVTVTEEQIGEAVGALKRYLELARGDGKLIRELEVANHLLLTREGMRWVMPFVLSAVAMLAHQSRKQLS
jgi:hypothetical protein